ICEETEGIVPGAQPLVNTGHGSLAEISQNQPRAPPGETTQFVLFDPVPCLSFARWEDPLRLVCVQVECIQNRPGAPRGLSGSQPGKKPGITRGFCVEHHQVIGAGLERGLWVGRREGVNRVRRRMHRLSLRHTG
ncbi:MAG: hypothetical protein ACKOJF_03175, partial [Planctomycetaceae bacterium]